MKDESYEAINILLFCKKKKDKWPKNWMQEVGGYYLGHPVP